MVLQSLGVARKSEKSAIFEEFLKK